MTFAKRGLVRCTSADVLRRRFIQMLPGQRGPPAFRLIIIRHMTKLWSNTSSSYNLKRKEEEKMLSNANRSKQINY